LNKEPENNKEALELIQNGTLGYFIWECIKEENGRYLLEIDPKLIKKGYLLRDRLYKVIFRFAENECKFLKNKL